MPSPSTALTPPCWPRSWSAEAEELGTLRLSRTQRADFLSDMLHYFGYHLDAINKVQSLRILGEIF